MFWVTSYVLSRSGKCSAMTSGRRPLAGPSSALRRATMIATSSGEFGSTSTGGAASAAASAAGFFCSRALDSVSIAPMSLPAALPPRSFGALTGDAAARRTSSAVRGSAAILGLHVARDRRHNSKSQCDYLVQLPVYIYSTILKKGYTRKEAQKV